MAAYESGNRGEESGLGHDRRMAGTLIFLQRSTGRFREKIRSFIRERHLSRDCAVPIRISGSKSALDSEWGLLSSEGQFATR